MRVLIMAGRSRVMPRLAVLVTAVLVTAVLVAANPVVHTSAAMAATASLPGNGTCYPVNFTWICVYSGNGGGRHGTGGGSSTITCTYTKAPRSVLAAAGTGPPAPGYQWDIMTCQDANPGPLGGQLVQVSKRTGTPAIRPLDLVRIGIGQLRVPTLTAATAPPRGKDGLVGLPEWYWVPRGRWHAVSVTVTAGPVWAKAVASPTALSYMPGGGLGSASCAGPGVPFRRTLPADQQHTDCAYTYTQSSLGQPGNAYRAGLFVTWTVSWTGSGGAGSVITNGYTTGTVFNVRVAQAEALVTTP